MEIVLLNGSPKASANNSAYFLDELKCTFSDKQLIKEYTLKKKFIKEDILNAISSCDILVMAFPLYVDSIPSHLLYFLEEIKSVKRINNKPLKVYAIVNCGFFEGHQTRIAIEIIKNWCIRCNFLFGQGIGIGAGEMFGSLNSVPLGHGPKKSLGLQLHILSNNIIQGIQGDNLYVSPNFPRFAFKFAAHIMWNQEGKKNGLTKKDLLK